MNKRKGTRLAVTRRIKVLIIISAVIILAGIGLIIWGVIRSHDTDIDATKYQAVFLENGEVYFGKLSPFGSGSYKLTDIFYLQGKSATENPQQTTTDSSDDVQLIKLGNEIHGPEDEMVITKAQVLFYENLKPGGNVAQTIQKYNASH